MRQELLGELGPDEAHHHGSRAIESSRRMEGGGVFYVLKYIKPGGVGLEIRSRSQNQGIPVMYNWIEPPKAKTNRRAIMPFAALHTITSTRT